MDELPKKVTDIDILKFNRNIRKICKCQAPHFEIDTTNRLIYCADCGAIWEPFEVILYLARHYERLQEQVESLLEDRKKIARYKAHSVIIKQLEQSYKKGEMLPHCPHCNKMFKLEQLIYWSNKCFYKEDQS